MDQYMGPTYNYTFHIFRGFLNSNGKGNECFCYVISFLQLFFHCDDEIKYLRLPNRQNPTEKYLSEMINKLYDNDNNYYIKISVNGQNYAFKGASVFKGEENDGHYTTILKISDKFIIFNDNRVFPLFFILNVTVKRMKRFILIIKDCMKDLFSISIFCFIYFIFFF